jgi:hypothetical protein
MLASLTSGFESSSYCSTTHAQHDANAKRYHSWADVTHALNNRDPVSMVVIETPETWTCHVIVHMFQISYTKEIIIGPEDPFVDDLGFVYHTVALSDNECQYDTSLHLLSFGLSLPDIGGQEEGSQMCLVDNEWRFVDRKKNWTYLG